ncbi:MAG: hypothetical protein Q4Q53_07100 [Methanocorpusculum sp.]|nr:hypothetical protein [Methanocorpusculum sp.]
MRYFFALSVLILTALLFSAGCIAESDEYLLPSTDVLNDTLDKFLQSIGDKAVDANERLTAFAHNVESADTPKEIENVVTDFYIDNIKLSYAAYYDSVNGETYVSPYFNTSGDYTKKIFEDVTFDGCDTKLYGPIFTKHHGTLCAFVHPVYNDGKVTGVVAGYNDPIAYVTDSALECGGLNSLGPLILDSEGYVFYSSFATDIGGNVYNFFAKSNKYSLAKNMAENETGVSEVFEGYTPGLVIDMVKRQAVWKTVSVCGKDLRVAVISSEETPELSADYVPDYKAMENAVREVYIYAFTHGKDKTVEALNDGTFSYKDFDVCAFDVDGTILASQKRPYQVGYNFNNWRSAYGVKTVETWGDIAQTSGGGYHYFTISSSEDPTEKEGTLCASYVMAVDSDWYLVSLIPAQAERVPVNIGIKNSLLETMQAALKMLTDYKQSAFDMFMNREGTELEGNSHEIMVLDKDGFVLSSNIPYLKVGTNALSLTDYSTGISLTRLLILKAESGRGFTSADFYDEKNNEEYSAVLYVEPLKDGRFIVVSEKASRFDSHKKQYLGW